MGRIHLRVKDSLMGGKRMELDKDYDVECIVRRQGKVGIMTDE